jgi:hypothetical protein
MLCFALSANSQERIRTPNGITFALSGWHKDADISVARVRFAGRKALSKT